MHAGLFSLGRWPWEVWVWRRTGCAGGRTGALASEAVALVERQAAEEDEAIVDLRVKKSEGENRASFFPAHACVTGTQNYPVTHGPKGLLT